MHARSLFLSPRLCVILERSEESRILPYLSLRERSCSDTLVARTGEGASIERYACALTRAGGASSPEGRGTGSGSCPLSRQVDPTFNFARVCGDHYDSFAGVERRHFFVSIEDFKIARAQTFEDCAVGDGVLQLCDKEVALAAARVAGKSSRARVDGAA